MVKPSLITHLQAGMIFECNAMYQPLRDIEVAKDMGRLLTRSLSSFVGYSSLHRDYVDRSGSVTLRIKCGFFSPLLFPWLTIHEMLHIYGIAASISPAFILLSPMLLHLALLGYFGTTLFLTMMLQNPWLDAVVIYMMLQQIMLFMGSAADAGEYYSLKETRKLQDRAMLDSALMFGGIGSI